MAHAAAVLKTRARANRAQALAGERLREAVSIAEAKGLLQGGRSVTMRGRMPASLVAYAKKKSGISSDTKLLEAALASIAVADDYGDWLISQRNTIGRELDLEF
jgi:hypothetical protein